jgi:hypothetical protein
MDGSLGAKGREISKSRAAQSRTIRSSWMEWRVGHQADRNGILEDLFVLSWV